jgi:Neocarzinostatin family
VGALIGFAALPASADAPTVSATPNTELADGQQVLVSASGFAADTSMAIVECATTTVSPAACDLDTVAFTATDDNGAYADVSFTVARILADGTDCALVGGCYIGTQDELGEATTASTLITFDPNIPPLPPLEIAVRIDKTLKVNDKGVVNVRGAVQCKNRGADVEVDVDLSQVFDRAIFDSFGFNDVLCDADTTVPFRLTLRPQNGLFGVGSAVVKVQAFAGSLSIFHRVGVNLIPHPNAAGAPHATKARLTWG